MCYTSLVLIQLKLTDIIYFSESRRLNICQHCTGGAPLELLENWKIQIRHITCWRLVQDDGVEECALSSSAENTKIVTSCWATIYWNPPKKDKDTYILWQRNQNPIPNRWATQKSENNNTKEVLPLLWRFWAPHQPSQAGEGTGYPQGVWLWRPVGFDYRLSQDWGKQRLHSWRAQTKPFMH